MSSSALSIPPPARRSHACGTWAGPPGSFEVAHVTAALDRRGEWALHRCSPQGLSGTLIDADRTIVLHTWPERGVATIDVWSADDAAPIAAELAEALGWRAVEQHAFPRS